MLLAGRCVGMVQGACYALHTARTSLFNRSKVRASDCSTACFSFVGLLKAPVEFHQRWLPGNRQAGEAVRRQNFDSASCLPKLDLSSAVTCMFLLNRPFRPVLSFVQEAAPEDGASDEPLASPEKKQRVRSPSPSPEKENKDEASSLQIVHVCLLCRVGEEASIALHPVCCILSLAVRRTFDV